MSLIFVRQFPSATSIRLHRHVHSNPSYQPDGWQFYMCWLQISLFINTVFISLWPLPLQSQLTNQFMACAPIVTTISHYLSSTYWVPNILFKHHTHILSLILHVKQHVVFPLYADEKKIVSKSFKDGINDDIAIKTQVCLGLKSHLHTVSHVPISIWQLTSLRSQSMLWTSPSCHKHWFHIK